MIRHLITLAGEWFKIGRLIVVIGEERSNEEARKRKRKRKRMQGSGHASELS